MPAISMQLTEKTIDSLNYALDDLEIEGTERFTLTDFVSPASSKEVERKVLKTCFHIIVKLNHYKGSAFSLSSIKNVQSVYTTVAPILEPNFDESSEYFNFRLLHFLVTQIQAQRLLRHATGGTQRREIAGKRGRVAFQLDKICKFLNI